MLFNQRSIAWFTLGALVAGVNTFIFASAYHAFTPHGPRLGVAVSNLVVIRQVLPDTAAAAAGLQPGDILLRVNGAPLTSAEDGVRQISHAPTGTIQLDVLRHNRSITLLADLPPSTKTSLFD